MGREIKFRGISKENGDLIYGDLVHNALNAYSKVIAIGIKSEGCYPTEVKPETVGQYTGLKDKNGVEIYEGDILIHKDTNPIKIVCQWFQGILGSGFLFFYRDGDKYMSTTGLYYEVIGNIYEHPHLLNS